MDLLSLISTFDTRMWKLFYYYSSHFKIFVPSFYRILKEQKGLLAAREMIKKPDVHLLLFLARKGELDKSVHALVMEKEFRDLFTYEDILLCKCTMKYFSQA